VIFDGLSITFAGDTSTGFDEAGAIAGVAASPVEVAGIAAAAGFALFEHADSTTAQSSVDPTTE
jgi:hypothetical protein